MHRRVLDFRHHPPEPALPSEERTSIDTNRPEIKALPGFPPNSRSYTIDSVDSIACHIPGKAAFAPLFTGFSCASVAYIQSRDSSSWRMMH